MHLLAIVDASNLRPFVILAICVAVIVVLITRLRVHAFLALIAAAFLAGFLTKEFRPTRSINCPPRSAPMPGPIPGSPPSN